MGHVRESTAAHELEKIERFNRLIANTEARRNALLREIERRRATFAHELRQQAKATEDGAFSALAHEAGSPPPSAGTEAVPVPASAPH